MTEAEWESCADPRRMLAALHDEESERKLRLFACAAWRWRYTRSAPWLLRQTIFRGMVHLLGRVERHADGSGEPLNRRWRPALTFALPSAWDAVAETFNTFEQRFLGLFDSG